jgi:hypothetical protein
MSLLPFSGPPAPKNVAGTGISIVNTPTTSTISLTGAPAGSLNYYSGYTANGESWSSVSSTFADPTPAAGNTLTKRAGIGITVTAAASNLPGITFTPASSSSTYFISAVFNCYGSSNGVYACFSLTDGTTPICQQTYGQGIALQQSGDVTLEGTYAPGSTSPVTIKIQMASPNTGTATLTSISSLTPSIEWTIIEIDSLVSSGGGSGTVTSVGFADTSTTPIYTITNSPVTTSGTIDQTLTTQSANTVFAGPTTGSAAQPTFRSLVSADVPTLNQNTTGTAANVTGVVAVANGGTGDSSFTANQVIIAGTTSTGAMAVVPTGTTGQVLQSNASSAPSFTSTLAASVQGNITTVGTVTTGVWNGTATGGHSFITSGTTYTTPAGITANTTFKFTLVGGGGAGGGNSATVNDMAGGGGGAGVAIVYLTGLAASTGYTVAIGSGGSGSSNAAGGNGGNTTLTALSTTYTASGGTGGPTGAATTAGGAGGSTTNATIGITGSNGGGSGTVGAPFGNGGSAATFGPGQSAPPRLAAGSAGTNATGYGGGGSGSNGGQTTGTAYAGGNGSAGCILVEWSN